MEKTTAKNSLISLFLIFAMVFTFSASLCTDAKAASTKNSPIITSYGQLSSSTTSFKITGNRFSHKKVTVEGVYLYSAAGKYTKAVTKWWSEHTKYYVWVYDKNGKLYKFYNGVKSGTKISLPIGKNSYSIDVRPCVNTSWREFRSACNGYVDASWSFAQYHLKT